MQHPGIKSYNQFQKVWRNLAPTTQFYVVISHGDSSTVHEVDPKAVSIYDAALIFRVTFKRDYLIRVPVTIKVQATLSPDDPEKRYTILREQRIWASRQLSWTDAPGRIKLIVKEIESYPGMRDESRLREQVVHLSSLVCNVHAQRLLEQFAKFKPIPDQSMQSSSCRYPGLDQYCVFFTLRNESAHEGVLMTLMAENNYVTQPQSHIENTVRMSIQSDLLPYRVNRPLVLEGDNDPLRLVADVTLFDKNGQVFWARSSYLWLRHHSLFQNLYSGEFLAYDQGFWLGIDFKIAESSTEITSVYLVLPLHRINRWYRLTRGYKLVDVARAVMKLEREKEDVPRKSVSEETLRS